MRNFHTNKSLGQHFLVDNQIINNIIANCGNLINEDVLEIGPGNCALTQHLAKLSKNLLCIEKDSRLNIDLQILKNKHSNFNYIIGDALSIDPLDLNLNPTILVSNLPYNVGTQIFLNYLFATLGKDNRMKKFILMFQKEVALRIMAQPSSSNYGRLSIITHLLANTHYLFDVPPNAFNPPPKVTSCVIAIEPLHTPRFNVNINKLEKITNLSFANRRKTIKNNLKTLNVDFDLLNIDSQKRPQDLSCEDFCNIANHVVEIP